MKDFHIKKLLVFPPGQCFTSFSVYNNRNIIVHDKASCLAVKALDPPPGSVVLDGCAAPGIKTVYLADCMKNTGLIYAVDRDKKRLKTLTGLVEEAGATQCKVICSDFLELDPHSNDFSKVEYILLDPSCSGSGMTTRIEGAPVDSEVYQNRLQSLSRFQIMLLKHAFKFPSVKRIVYSTCSVNTEENEDVIDETTYHAGEGFHLKEILPEWTWRGCDNYAFGQLCVRAHPNTSLTSGFFVALFEKCVESPMQD